MDYNLPIMEATKPRQLTNKERALVRALANESLTQAALDAGYSSKNPGQSGWQALENIRHKVPELLDQHGLTDEALIEKHLKPLLSATEIKFFPYKGKIISSRRVPAHATRVKALDIAFRLHGSYASRTIEDAGKKTIEVIVMDVPRPLNQLPGPFFLVSNIRAAPQFEAMSGYVPG